MTLKVASSTRRDCETMNGATQHECKSTPICVAPVTLAVGLGATAVVFAVLDALFRRRPAGVAALGTALAIATGRLIAAECGAYGLRNLSTPPWRLHAPRCVA